MPIKHNTQNNPSPTNQISTSTNECIKLIYVGGTFGCVGSPLAPLPAHTFLPIVYSLLQSFMPCEQKDTDETKNDVDITTKVTSTNVTFANVTFANVTPAKVTPADDNLNNVHHSVIQDSHKHLLYQLSQPYQPYQIETLPNQVIKDSSQLTPSDFIHFYQLILTAYNAGYRRFIIITGTDTLSYLSAFLAEAFAGSSLCVALTASMQPLLKIQNNSQTSQSVSTDLTNHQAQSANTRDYTYKVSNKHAYQINEHSDAWTNLQTAICHAIDGCAGVRVCMDNQCWDAQTVQKLNSHGCDTNDKANQSATHQPHPSQSHPTPTCTPFTGHVTHTYPANSFTQPSSTTMAMAPQSVNIARLITQATLIDIPILYCLPSPINTLLNQFNRLLPKAPSAIILLGFGAGNLPYSDTFAQSLTDAYDNGHMVVMSTQCPMGGVSSAYSAGAWQYQHHVLSGKNMTLPAIYARLLWLLLTYDSPSQRRQAWLKYMH